MRRPSRCALVEKQPVLRLESDEFLPGVVQRVNGLLREQTVRVTLGRLSARSRASWIAMTDASRTVMWAAGLRRAWP